MSSRHNGHLIRVARVACHLQLSDLAAAAEISPSYLSLIERGHRPLLPRIVDRLRDALITKIGR